MYATTHNEFLSNTHPLIIAEIGTSHAGSINKAKELVNAARESGADAAKFQIVYADEILHQNTGTVPLPTGNIPLYDHFKSLEVSKDFYFEIAEYCKKNGIQFAASAFGMSSAHMLDELQPSFSKIASPELNYTELIRRMVRIGVPVVLSSGVSKLADIEQALETARLENPAVPLALLHCVTAYPAPESDYNLSLLPLFKTLFACAVGVSDHSLDPILVPALSIGQGASIIEKHICLSKNDTGLDDPVALEPHDFSRMSTAVKKYAGKKLNYIITDLVHAGYTKQYIDAVIGTGEKTLSPAEHANYASTNRSLHYTAAFKKGHCIQEKDIGILRSEKHLTVGAAPCMLPLFLQSVLQKDVQNGDGAVLTDIIQKEGHA